MLEGLSISSLSQYENCHLDELTVPSEDRVHAAHHQMKSKNTLLASICEENGFRFHLIPTEVGCLGYCPHSLLRGPHPLPRKTVGV